MNKFIPGWYVLYTRPRHERKVAYALSDVKMEFYFPTRKTLRIWRDRKKFIESPLFQSYIFVYLNDLREYFNGLNISGVLKYVCIGREVARISDKVIAEMRLLIDHGNGVEITSENFEQGQQLLIQHGPLTGVSCEVIQSHNRQKILVRMNLLQRNLLLSLPADHFVAVVA